MIKKLLDIFWNFQADEDTAEDTSQVELTEKTEKVIDKLISSETLKSEVTVELKKYCIYYKKVSFRDENEYPERMIFAILKIATKSGSYLEKDFLEAMDLARFDFRDLLGAAGFASKINTHNDWAAKILAEADL